MLSHVKFNSYRGYNLDVCCALVKRGWVKLREVDNLKVFLSCTLLMIVVNWLYYAGKHMLATLYQNSSGVHKMRVRF